MDKKKFLISSSSTDKRIPKFCNVVTFHKQEDGNIIITFLAKETFEQVGSEEEAMIIEKIVVSEKHAEKIANKLKEIL